MNLTDFWKSGSKSFREANSDILKANPIQCGTQPNKNALQTPQNAKSGLVEHFPERMNKTEREFSILLDIQKQDGEILRWEFEPMRLRWGDTMFYKPDFLVVKPNQIPLLIEVKGAHIWSRDLVRFKGCRAEWKDCFFFQLWQKTKDGWGTPKI